MPSTPRPLTDDELKKVRADFAVGEASELAYLEVQDVRRLLATIDELRVQLEAARDTMPKKLAST